MAEPAAKSLIVGVDGATFDVIDPLLAAGKLPNLARLVRQGVRAPLRSTFPPLSAPAWISAITGCHPARHGLFHFHHHHPAPSERQELCTLASVQVPTLWDWLAAEGQPGICVNVPLTYPPQRLDGVVMISGFGTPPHAREICWPPELLAALERETGAAYRSHEPPIRDFSPRHFRESGLPAYAALEEQKARAMIAAMRRHPWRVAMFCFTMTDRIQHFLFGERALLDEVYGVIDRLLGLLLGQVDPSTAVFVMSDHGFGRQRGDFFTSAFLHERGHLVLKPGGPLTRYRIRIARPTVERVLTRLGRSGLARRLPAWLLRRRLLLPLPAWKGARLVDWSRTRAYAGSFGIFVNLRGREPCGIVAPGAEYEAERERLLAELRALRDPESGEPLISRAWRREELHAGPCIEEAPDVLFMVRELEYVQSDRFRLAPLLGPTRFQGTHRMDGILVAAGPQIRRGAALETASIVDVMPSALHAAGMAVPSGLDGTVLASLFEPAALQARPARFKQALERGASDSGDAYGDAEKEEIAKRLRSLGYL